MPNKFVSLLPTLPQAQAYGRNVPKPKVFAGSLHSRPGESPRGSESSPSVAAAGSGPVAGNGGRGRPEADSALEMEELQRLAERHALEKQRTEAIRHNMENSVFAR